MQVINPPPIRIPLKFAQDKELNSYFTQLHIYLRQLWERALPSDGIEDEDAALLVSMGLSAGSQMASIGDEVLQLRAELAALHAGLARVSAVLSDTTNMRGELAALHATTGRLSALEARINEVETLCLS